MTRRSFRVTWIDQHVDRSSAAAGSSTPALLNEGSPVIEQIGRIDMREERKMTRKLHAQEDFEKGDVGCATGHKVSKTTQPGRPLGSFLVTA